MGLNKCDFTPYEILTFFGAPCFLCVLTPHDNLPCFGPPSPLTFQHVKNHEKGNAERGARENWWGTKNGGKGEKRLKPKEIWFWVKKKPKCRKG